MVLTSIVSPTESLGRYLPQRAYYSIAKNSVKPQAFMPPLDLRLSVFRIDGLQLEEIWKIGQREVIDASPQPRELYGIADVKALKVQENDLEVEPDNIPPRHANIIGWPEEKAQRMLIAQELAAGAKLVLK